MPKLTPDGCRIIIINFPKYASDFDVDVLYKKALAGLDFLYEADILRTGAILIFDDTFLQLAHIVKIFLPQLKKFITVLLVSVLVTILLEL